ncbi:MAG: putative collagen-binding domain-containing protein, partial [Planctomycetaceae bacterium]
MWQQTRIALEFFHAHLPFAEMQAADELTPTENDYCFAKPGEVYAIYLPPGTEPRLELPAGMFRVEWFNPRAGGELQPGEENTVIGPGTRSLGRPLTAPEKEKDWVVLVRRR